MGIIIRQGIKTTIVNFIGAFVGMISVLFIYPLEKELVGFASNLYSMASFLTPFIGIGAASIAIKFYFKLKTENEKSPAGFLVSILMYILITLLSFLLISYLCKEYFYAFLLKLNFDASIFSENELSIVTFSTLLVTISVFTVFSQIKGRNTVPSIITNFCYKLYLPFLVIMIYLKKINGVNLDLYVVGFYAAASILLAFYIFHFRVFNFHKNGFKRIWNMKNEMISFGLFSGLTSLGSILAFRIDSVMISGFLDYSATGSYVLPMTMAAVMDIPNQAFLGITSPIVSKAWSNKDLTHLNVIYQKGSMNLMIAGVFILLMGTFCFDDLVKLSSNPSAFNGVKWVFIILCFAKLTDMATSVNSAIIGYSDFYKFNLYFVSFLGLSNVLLNILLIPTYGIIGAAIATFISLALFNLLKLIFIYKKFKLNPFTYKTIQLLIIAILFFLITYYFSNILDNAFISILVKGFILAVIFTFILYKMKFSEDLNKIIEKVFFYLKGIVQSFAR